MFGKIIWTAATVAILYLAVISINGGFDLQANPPKPERAKLVECYDYYDDYGDLTYACDFFQYSENEYVTKTYQRQAWNQMKSGIGGDYMLDLRKNNDVALFMLGFFLLCLAGCTGAAAYNSWTEEKYHRWH